MCVGVGHFSHKQPLPSSFLSYQRRDFAQIKYRFASCFVQTSLRLNNTHTTSKPRKAFLFIFVGVPHRWRLSLSRACRERVYLYQTPSSAVCLTRLGGSRRARLPVYGSHRTTTCRMCASSWIRRECMRNNWRRRVGKANDVSKWFSRESAHVCGGGGLFRSVSFFWYCDLRRECATGDA